MTASIPTRVADLPSRLAVAGVSLAAFLAACMVPALRFDKEVGPDQVMRGYEAALLGWQALFVGNVGWLANPIFWLALLMLVFGQRDASFVCGGIAFLLSFDSLRLLGRTLKADEGGVTHMVLTQMDVGYYLWTTSLGLVLLGTFWLRARARTAGRS